LNTTHTTQKNRWYRINLNHQIFTYRSFFITHESFSTGGKWYCIPWKTSYSFRLNLFFHSLLSDISNNSTHMQGVFIARIFPRFHKTSRPCSKVICKLKPSLTPSFLLLVLYINTQIRCETQERKERARKWLWYS
jgi:hypothetical protein